MLLVGNGKLITRNEMLPYVEDGAVAIDGQVTREIGSYAELKAKYPDAEFVDARGGVIMPGLINVHTHIYSGLARGLSINGFNPTNFFEVLDGQWWYIDRHLTLDGTKACAYATVLDCIRDGVTTIFDHHASFCEIPGSLFAIKDVCQELGIRANLCYEVSERDGMEKCDQSIRENADFAKWCKEQDDDMIRAMFGGHALFTISDQTFEKMVKANDGMTGFHIHVAEGMNDVYDSLRNYGCKPVNRLLYNGILGKKTMLGHCIHVSPSEMDIIKETGTMVCHNPCLLYTSHPWSRHAFGHPRTALENARARFPVNPTEADIILTHMFPLTITWPYRCLESLVVSTADKVCAVAELLHLTPAAEALPAPSPAVQTAI